MEKNVVILDVNDYNKLIAKATKCQVLEEEKLLLEAEITDLKYGKVQLEHKLSSDKGESTITQRPKCTTIKVKRPEGAVEFEKLKVQSMDADSIFAKSINTTQLSDEFIEHLSSNVKFIELIKKKSIEAVETNVLNQVQSATKRDI